MISMSPVRRQLQFHFTIFSGSMKTEDTIFWLTQLHHYYQGKKVLILWDRLSCHLAAQQHFEASHPDWFIFEYLPSYSPELNYSVI